MEEQKYEVSTRKAPEINLEIIKKYICPKATDQEAYTFMQLCKAQNLNPFLREAYLVKYGDEAATIITGKDTFTKRADRLPQYDGFKAGIVVLSQAQIVHREGSLLISGERLIGGWAEVFRKDRGQSFRNEVSLSEYERKKKDGSLMSNWRLMPATMIRKVALVQSLREAFPDEFGGMYSPEEMPIDVATLPTYDYGNHPVYPKPQEDNPPIKEPQKKAKPTDQPDPPQVKDPDAPSTEPQHKAIHALLGKLGIKDEMEKHEKATALAGIDGETITSMTALNKGQASTVIAKLSAEVEAK